MTTFSRGALDRFWANVPLDGATECWPWGASTTKAGYGQIMMDGKMWYAHRVMAVIVTGDDPPEMVDHSCKRHDCVNPAHLRASGALLNASNMHNGNPFMGVSYDARKDRYCADMMTDGIRFRRSNFPTREAAREWLQFVRWHMKPLDEVNNAALEGVDVPPLTDLFPKPKRGRQGQVPTKSKREGY